MMRLLFLVGLLLVTLWFVACGGGPSGPSPVDHGRFLAGTYPGTLTVHRAGVPDVSGTSTWTFDPVPNTDGFSYRVRITAQHPWLPSSLSGTADLVPPGVAPSDFLTLGAYDSPRGCTGTFKAEGKADEHRLTGSFRGVDCDATFEGSVTLSR